MPHCAWWRSERAHAAPPPTRTPRVRNNRGGRGGARMSLFTLTWGRPEPSAQLGLHSAHAAANRPGSSTLPPPAAQSIPPPRPELKPLHTRSLDALPSSWPHRTRIESLIASIMPPDGAQHVVGHSSRAIEQREVDESTSLESSSASPNRRASFLPLAPLQYAYYRKSAHLPLDCSSPTPS